MKYVFGVGPDNKAPRPIDNVGVQYGLANLLNGTLTKDRFVDVNWRIGGMDIDGVWQPQRTEADLGALATLYRTGRITDGSGSANVAEIDLRNNPTDVGFHPPFHSWTWRARIDRTLGNHDNNVIWVQRTGGTPPSQFEEMRKWLDAVYSDPSGDPLSLKIREQQAGDRAGHLLRQRRQWRQPERPVLHGHARAVAVLRAYADGRGHAVHAGHVQVPVEAARAGGLSGDQLHRPRSGRSCRRPSPPAYATSASPRIAQQPSQPWVSFAGGPGGQPLGDTPKSIGVNRPVALCKDVAIQACSVPQADVNNGSYDPDGDAFTPRASAGRPVPARQHARHGAGGGCARLPARAWLTSIRSPRCGLRSGASASPASLWPPNKRMVPVAVALSATDACSGDVTSSCRIVSISGDDSATAADWRITGPLSASCAPIAPGKATGAPTRDDAVAEQSGNLGQRWRPSCASRSRQQRLANLDLRSRRRAP